MKQYSVTMTVAVNATVEADNEEQARLIALCMLWNDLSEFDRKVDNVEDITPVQPKPRKGRGSY